MLQQTSLQNEHVMAAEWEKADNLQELDISATDLSKECLMDVLPRIPALQWLSAGQLDGMTDAVFKVSYLPQSRNPVLHQEALGCIAGFFFFL